MRRRLQEDTRIQKVLASVPNLPIAPPPEWNQRPNSDLLRLAVAQSSIILYALDLNRNLLFIEGGGLGKLGWPSDREESQSFLEVCFSDPEPIAKIDRVFAGEEISWIGKIRNFAYHHSAVPLRDDRERIIGLVGVATDVTVSCQTEVTLKVRAHQQAAVAHLGQLALAETDYSVLLDEAVKLVTQTLAVEYCQVWELLPDGCSMRLQAGVGWQAGVVGQITEGVQHNTQAHYTLKVNQPVIVTDLRTERRFDGSGLLQDHQVCSGLSVVIPNRGKQRSRPEGAGKPDLNPQSPISTAPLSIASFSQASKSPNFGVLAVYSTNDRPFTEDDIQFLQAIANVLAQAIERQHSEEQIRLLASAVYYAQDSILITSTDLCSPGPQIAFVNPAFTKMTGYTAAEAIGQTPRLLQGPKTDRRVLERLRDNLSEGQMFYGETINYRKDGSEFYNEWHIEPIGNNRGEVTHYLAIQRDITERKLAEKRLWHEAFHDSLTGLPNRAYFRLQLQEAMAAEKQGTHQGFAVLFLDLDRFKVINDSLGHHVGNQMLVAIAGRLKSCLRSGDTVARLGGDEFALLLSDLPAVNDLSTLLERLHAAIRKPLLLDTYEVFTSASIGIVFVSKNQSLEESPSASRPLASSLSFSYEQPEDLLRDADIAMYRAKAKGGARSIFFNQAMRDEVVMRLQLENDLRRAIARNELCLHYQPIVTLATGQIMGFEALVRWQHPERGLISPQDFIPIAEETGLIVPLGWWVLHQACHQLKRWHLEFPSYPPLTMSINLSGRQFMQLDLIERLDRILREVEGPKSSQSNSLRHSLKLEITETTIMENADMAIAMLGHLRALGVQLAIDDFGTGYSSLSRLYHFPINTLKIDRSFVSRMGTQQKKTEIVRAIVALAHSLEMDVIAEGIETAEQLASLQDLNCEQGQGYLYSPPVNSDRATTLLQQQWVRSS